MSLANVVLNPVKTLTGIILLALITFGCIVIAEKLSSATFNVAEKDLSENDITAELGGELSNANQKSTSKDKESSSGDFNVLSIDGELQVDDNKRTTQPAPKDPLRQSAPAPITPTQPNQDYFASEDITVDKVQWWDQESNRKIIRCLDNAILGLIFAAIIVLTASILQSAVEWLTGDVEGYCKENNMFPTSVVVEAECKPGKANLFTKTPQIHKV